MHDAFMNMYSLVLSKTLEKKSRRSLEWTQTSRRQILDLTVLLICCHTVTAMPFHSISPDKTYSAVQCSAAELLHISVCPHRLTREGIMCALQQRTAFSCAALEFIITDTHWSFGAFWWFTFTSVCIDALLLFATVCAVFAKKLKWQSDFQKERDKHPKK